MWKRTDVCILYAHQEIIRRKEVKKQVSEDVNCRIQCVGMWAVAARCFGLFCTCAKFHNEMSG